MLRRSPDMGSPRLRYRREPSPIYFPVEAEVPESKRHLSLRTLLFEFLQRAFADRHSIGCDQFVYWDASTPRRCLAPDGFVRLGTPDTAFDSWKTWERGAPEVAIEIVSEFDASEATWQRKLVGYHQLGVLELVRFDADAAPGERIRAWDRIEGDLVERIVEGDVTPCRALDSWWHVRPGLGFPATLRMARDEAGTELLPTSVEELDAARAEIERLKGAR